ncbi:MAG: hydrogenase maturation nickel metallochaperone HypA [Campylobacterota bacterium]|nr:hydrogenase maturation nickel metallochaperone HypA [Campylobacterota bacterium]
MHEYSIVQSLIDSCEEHLKENGATKVTKVVVKIGVLSGVEPYLLESAFDMFKDDTVCEGALLVLNIQKVAIVCNSCKIEQELEKNEFVCPLCGSYDIKVLDGEEMFLMSLDIE